MCRKILEILLLLFLYFTLSKISISSSDAGEAGSSDVSFFGTIIDLIRVDSSVNSARPMALRLDDGTGTISCVYFRPDKLELQDDIKIGDDLLAYGTIQEYRDSSQLRCEKIKFVSDPNFQSLWINQVIYYKELMRSI